MVTTVRSLGLQGISGYEVTVECFLSGGLPAFDVVGLGDTAVKEARERVRAAIKNCGAKFPVSRITVNERIPAVLATIVCSSVVADISCPLALIHERISPGRISSTAMPISLA